VPKLLGEKAVDTMKKAGIINRDLIIEKKDEFIYIPLKEELSHKLLDSIQEIIPQASIINYLFNTRKIIYKHPIEAAKETIPASLIDVFPKSIDYVGDIAIVKLPSDLEEFRKQVGEAILQANTSIRLVLAKKGAVKNEYRLRDYEIIGGKGSTETIHHEYGCRYQLDLSKVFFSPRLSYEHNRIASNFNTFRKETVIDMFAGIGPFSILIAKKNRLAKIYAIDINPDAISYLKKNIVGNRVIDQIIPILGDVKKIVKDRLENKADRAIMNLPELSYEYIVTAINSIKSSGGIVHYYGFIEGDNPIENMRKRTCKLLNNHHVKNFKFLSSRKVRGIAPHKWQIGIDLLIENH
jgi:tRNA (guanine37-N1)-methyltransferase